MGKKSISEDLTLTFSPCIPTPPGPVGPGKPGGPKSPWKWNRLVLITLAMLQVSLMISYCNFCHLISYQSESKCICAAHLISFNSHSLLSPRPPRTREPPIPLWSKIVHSCQAHQSYLLLIHCLVGTVFSTEIWKESVLAHVSFLWFIINSVEEHVYLSRGNADVLLLEAISLLGFLDQTSD